MVEPIERKVRRTDEVADVLLDAVIDGRYPPGTALPPERDLAEQLGVNRTSLRQALTRLAQMGVVRSHQGRGTVVLDVADATDPALVGRLLARHGPALLLELFEVRQALGALVGRLAAQRADGADLDTLERDLARARSSRSPEELQRHELAFFGTLVTATANRPLRSMLRWVEQGYGSSADAFVTAFGDHEAVLAGLDAIAAAVRAHEPDAAAEAMDAYATASATRMLESLTGQAP